MAKFQGFVARDRVNYMTAAKNTVIGRIAYVVSMAITSSFLVLYLTRLSGKCGTVGQFVCLLLPTTSILLASLTGTPMFMSATRTLRATRAPASRQIRARACSRGSGRVGRHRRWQRRLGGLQRVEASAATACVEAERQRKTQPIPELCAGDGDIVGVGGGEDRKQTAGVWPGRGEQQGTRRWRKAGKMRLERVLVTASASPALPATIGGQPHRRPQRPCQ